MSQPAETPAPGQDPVTETRAFWREVGRDMVRKAIEATESTAKQVIGVAGILEGLYFHAITFSDLRQALLGQGLLVYLAPIFLLLISLAAALLVFFPQAGRVNINSSLACQVFYERILTWKLWLLRLASLFLVLGVLALLFALRAYLTGI